MEVVTTQQNGGIVESEKSTGTESDIVQSDIENNPGGEITLEQFQNAIANNLDIKGYYDSVVDKTVNKRLDKSIESWKNQNLQNEIETEINKRYPQKTEQEIQFEEQQKALEQAMEDKKQLQLQIKYQNIMAENKLPMDILDFVAGKDVENTISNIERFKTMTDDYIKNEVDKEVVRRFKQGSYVPPGSDDWGTSGGSMWN